MYNPLSETNLGAHIVLALSRQPVYELAAHHANTFKNGGGIYALYYYGDCKLYHLYKRHNSKSPKFPIYVGKASAASTINGLQSLRIDPENNALSKRIMEHKKTIAKIQQASPPPPYKLEVNDFLFRYLNVGDAHVSLAEAALITFLRPVLNGSGFGNHTPGGGRPGKKEPDYRMRAHLCMKNPQGGYWPPPSTSQYRDIRRRIVEQIRFVRRRNSDMEVEQNLQMLRAILNY